MNKQIQELAEQCYEHNSTQIDVEKFAELIVKECLSIVKSNIYRAAGEYDYGYSDENFAADSRAETIYDDIVYCFGME